MTKIFKCRLWFFCPQRFLKKEVLKSIQRRTYYTSIDSFRLQRVVLVSKRQDQILVTLLRNNRKIQKNLALHFVRKNVLIIKNHEEERNCTNELNSLSNAKQKMLFRFSFYLLSSLINLFLLRFFAKKVNFFDF